MSRTVEIDLDHYAMAVSVLAILYYLMLIQSDVNTIRNEVVVERNFRVRQREKEAREQVQEVQRRADDD